MQTKYIGIKTNNLQNINISLKQNSISLLQGPSGSGKSSVAIDTIHKISEDELYQLLNIKEDISNYSIKSYSNILPSICLKQENYNTNPRSTIATYFNLDSFFREIFSKESMLPTRLFSFNLPESSCDKCNGLGIQLEPDILKIIDFSTIVKNIPFIPWRNSKKSYYKQLVILFAEANNINIEMKYSELTSEQQIMLSTGMSQEKYRIKYETNGCNHVKTAKYIGPVSIIENELVKDKRSRHYLNYCSYEKCNQCNGGRFDSSILQYEILNKSIADLYLMEAGSLLKWLTQHKNKLIAKKENIKTYNNICSFLENMAFLKLSYLNLNRSIPSLSGGELQRLRLAKSITSHFFNFLYVLDEPTAGLHPSEWTLVSKILKNLKQRKNTILLIEHNPFIEEIADSIICLGPEGGKGGGKIVSKKKIIPSSVLNNLEFFPFKSEVVIKNASSNNINDITLNVPLNSFLGICGASGSGKTSLIKNILPKHLNNSTYLNQSPISGNAYSIIATSLGIMSTIQNLFTKKCNVSKEYFTFSSKGKGQCQLCKGKGFIQELSSNSSYEIICPDCDGKRFSQVALKKKHQEMSIFDFLNQDISDIKKNIEIENDKFSSIVSFACDIGLGYLNLFQKISSLSGGEAQRVKFISTLFKSTYNRVFLLDEPFRGVDNDNIYKMIKCLYDLVRKGYTVIVAEHNPNVLKYTSYIIELGPSGGDQGGEIIFQGKTSEITRAGNSSIMKTYL